MTKPRILGISGSLRQGSFNRKLVHEAARLFGEAEFEMAYLHLPLYDGDLEEAEGIPPSVQKLADQIAAADGIILSAPEYNKGISGVLKNVLDWVSRVKGQVLRDKPVALVAAAAGRTGGETAHYMTRHCLVALQAHVLPGNVLIAGPSNEFDNDEHLISDRYKDQLSALMDRLRAEIG